MTLDWSSKSRDVPKKRLWAIRTKGQTVAIMYAHWANPITRRIKEELEDFRAWWVGGDV